MIKKSSLVNRLRHVNTKLLSLLTYYLYDDLTYSIVYKIIKSYKRKPEMIKTSQQSRFNKKMFKLRIKVKHDFVIH